MNTSSNEGKNDVLVDFLNELSESFYQYYINIKEHKYQRLKRNIKVSEEVMEDNLVEKQIGVETPAEGVEIPRMDYFYRSEDIGNYTESLKKFDTAKIEVEDSLEKLIFLRDTMRTYLKIEWNIAKSGK